MAQKRTSRPSGLEYGKSGEAKLVKLDANKARFDFANGSKSVELRVVQGNIFEDENATLPDCVPFKAMKENSSLNVRVSFEKDEKRVLFINPWSGEMRVKFVRFQAPEGSAPSWTEKLGKGKKPYREANPFVEVIDGRWKGLIVRGRLFDNFGKDEEDGNTTIFFGSKGTSSENLEDFCTCVGFEYWETPYSENNLPEIQKVALENDNEFTILLVNGYISNWTPGMGDDEAFVDEQPTINESAESLLED